MVIKCPNCNQYVIDSVTICPHCGAILKNDSPSSEEEQAPENHIRENHPINVPQSTQYAQPELVEQPNPPKVEVPQVETSSVQTVPQSQPQVDISPSPSYSAPVAPIPSSSAYQEAKKSNGTLIGIIVLLALIICGVGGYLYYDNVYLPEKIDREAPRYYTMANMVVLRSSRSSGADYNKIGSLPFGTELITYEYDSEWARVKVATPNGDGKKLEGFVARPYILGKKDFFLLNSLFGNQDSREVIVTTKCRIALLDYFKTQGYIGAMDNQIRSEAGISTSPNGENEWQVFCKPKDAKLNSVLFKRLYNKNSQFTDFAVIINNITNGNRKLLYFYFDEDETPHLLTEQDAPREGYIKDAYISRNYYSGEEQLNVVYSN